MDPERDRPTVERGAWVSRARARPLPTFPPAQWLGGILVVALAAYVLSGVFTVAADEQAVVRRFGRVTGRLGPGIHYRLPWPVDRVDVVKTTTVMKTGVGFDLPRGEAPIATGMEILTGDTNIIGVAIVLQYVIRNPAAVLFQIEDPPTLIGSLAESVLTETVLGMPVDEVLTTGRLEIQERVKTGTQALLDRYESGIQLTSPTPARTARRRSTTAGATPTTCSPGRAARRGRWCWPPRAISSSGWPRPRATRRASSSCSPSTRRRPA